MPQAVALWAGTAVWAAGAGALAAQAVGVAAWVATNAALVGGLTAAQQKLAAKQVNDSGRFQSREIPISSPKAPQVVVYGQAWVAGVVSYANSRHTPGTKDNFEMYKQFVHTCHECESITDIYYDEDRLIDGTHITWAGVNGLVTSGKYHASKLGTYAVMLERTLGTTTQAQSAMLSSAFPVDYPGSGVYRLRGWSTTTHRFTYFSKTAKDAEGIFYSGVPNNIRALVKGMKVYDPRSGLTVWSDNPILCAADYMVRYMGIATSRIDWAWVASHANVCDAGVNIPPATTQKRYTCNGALSLGNSHLTNLQQILASCMGSLSKSAGLWRPTAGYYFVPDVSISDVDVVGEMTMTASVSRRDRYNTVTTSYFDPNSYGLEVDSLPMYSATYVARDGGVELPVTIASPLTNSEYQAQRIAFKHMLQSDRQTVITVPLRWTALAINIGTRVNVTLEKYAWNNKVFRCINWEMQDAGSEAPFVVTLREDDSTTWADPTVPDYSTRDASGAVTAGIVEIPTPTAGGSAGEITIQNANMETQDWYWLYQDSAWSIGAFPGSAGPHQGSFQMRCTGNAGTTTARNYIFYPCKPGAQIRVGCWALIDTAWAGVSVYPRANYYTQAKAEISQTQRDSLSNASTRDTWQLLEAVGTAPAGTHFVRFEVIVNGQSAGNAYFDDTYMLVNAGASIGDDLGDGSGGIVDHIPPIENILPSGYYDNETLTNDAYKPHLTTTVVLSTANAYVGRQSVLVTGTTGNGDVWGFQLVPRAATLPNLYIRPGRRWLIGCAVLPSSNIANSVLFRAGYSSNGTLTNFRNSTVVATGAAATWTMLWMELDGSADSIIWTTLGFYIVNPTALGAAPSFYIDAIKMIDVTDQPWLTEDNPPTTMVPAVGANPRPPETERLRYFRVKTANETISSDNTLTNDSELIGWTLDAGSMYEFEALIKFNSGATPDFIFHLNYTSALAAAGVGWVEQVNAAGNISSFWDGVATEGAEGGASDQALWLKLVVETNGATTVDFQWAQSNSTASNTTVYKGSYGKWTKIPPTECKHMVLAVDKARVDNVSRFERLNNEAGQLTQRTQKWMDETASFFAGLTDPAEKAEVKAMRDKLIADLKAILG